MKESEKTDVALEEFKKEHIAFLNNMIGEQRKALQDKTDESIYGGNVSAIQNSRVNMLYSFQDQLAYSNVNGLIITGVVVQGKSVDLQSFISSSKLSTTGFQCIKSTL